MTILMIMKMNFLPVVEMIDKNKENLYHMIIDEKERV